MHDILDIEKRGVPGAFIASEEFVDAAKHQGNALGYHPRQLFVPHPIQDRTNEEIESLAEHAFDQVMDMIFDSQDAPQAPED